MRPPMKVFRAFSLCGLPGLALAIPMILAGRPAALAADRVAMISGTARTSIAAEDPEAVAVQYQLQHAPVTPSYQLYTVRQGDTLQRIAQRYHDAAWLIARRSGGWQIWPGKRLTVLQWPFDRAYTLTLTTRTDRPGRYTVKSGDSLSTIAAALRTDVPTLAGENGIDPAAYIYAGQQLVLHHYTYHYRPVQVPATPIARLHTGLLLTDMANMVRMDSPLFKALVYHESGWQMVRGGSGEIGMSQLMPYMADWVQRALLGYRLDPRVPANNALEGALLLAYYLDINHHDAHKALASYHSGNELPNRRNGDYIRAIAGLRAYFYHHPRIGY